MPALPAVLELNIMFSWFRKKDKDKNTALEDDQSTAQEHSLNEQSTADEQAPAAVDEPVTPLTDSSATEQHSDASTPAASAPKQTEEQASAPQSEAEAAVSEAPSSTLEADTATKPEQDTAPEPEPESEPEPEQPLESVQAPESVPAEEKKQGWFARLRQGLARTSASFGEGVATLFLGRKAIDDELFEDLETHLITADVGLEATQEIVSKLTQRVARKELSDSEALYHALQEELEELLQPVEQPMQLSGATPQVILVVGVNGAGKTTTIGKLAARLQKEGKKVMLAAGDTFRAAAVEQLQVWGERNDIPVVAQHTGADSASVIFDAVEAAQARGVDVLIADTAGRLHNKDNLMEELKKVQRVMSRLDENAPHEVLLVLDAGTGQNAINQTRQFNEAVKVSGIVLTKLDGTAKGGVIFALAKLFSIPVRFIGVGEGIDDLRPFVAKDFVRALFSHKDSE